MACSVLRSYFRSLKTDTKDERPCSFSGSASTEPSLSRSSGRRQDADPTTTQVGQDEIRTKLTHFDNVVLSKPLPNCLRTSSCDKRSPPLVLPFSLSSSSKQVTPGYTQHPALLIFLRADPHPCWSSQLSLSPKKLLLFHFGRKPPLSFVKSFVQSIRAVLLGNLADRHLRSVQQADC